MSLLPSRFPASPLRVQASVATPLLALVCFAAACGGAQVGSPDGGGGGSGGGGGGGGGQADGGVYTAPDGATCVDIDVSTYDQSCERDSDCIPITPGTICTGECVCDVGATVNRSEETHYQAALSGLGGTSGICACVSGPSPLCLNHKCTLCDGPGPCSVGGSDAGCPSGDPSCGTTPVGPGLGFAGPGGAIIDWGSACTGDVYDPDGPGWAICLDGVWEYTTVDPASLGGYTEFGG
jgi:hypothetical protein